MNGPAGVTRFLYDGDRLIAEYDYYGALLRRYVHGPGTDEPVAVYEGSSLGLANRRYMLPDERGSIAALVNANGTPSAINTYDEYGIPGAGNRGRFQYTGQAWLPELGMYYYKARIYSPTLGRFLQVDPIGYEDQINLYAYVGNDPLNQVDATGQRAIWVTEKNGQITIQYMLAYTGPGNNAETREAIGSYLEGLRTPNGENIEVITVEPSKIGMRGVTEVRLNPGGFNGNGCTTGTSCAARNGNLARVNSSGNDVGPVGAHEVSHTGNAKDGYREGPRVNGQRTQLLPHNKPASDVMTTRTGDEYTPQTINEIRNGARKRDTLANDLVCAAKPDYPGCQ